MNFKEKGITTPQQLMKFLEKNINSIKIDVLF